MKNILFINGQSQNITDIFTGMMPEGAPFTTKAVPATLSDEEKIAALEGIEYLVLHPATLPDHIIRQAKSLKLIQLLTAGYDKVDIEAAAGLGIPVATNGGANAWSVAEHTIALMLAIYKKLEASDLSVRAGTWRKPINGFNTFEMSGKTVGIVGAGNIGRKVAARVKPFETDILYYDAFAVPEMEDAYGARRVELDELVRAADIITLHAPLLDSTRGMLGEKQFAAMKKTAILINAARSELIDQSALVAALTEGRIAGAGIDVYQKEPVPADDPLLKLENVLLTPHTAGFSYEGWFRRAQTAWNNITKVEAGEKPGFVVNNV